MNINTIEGMTAGTMNYCIGAPSPFSTRGISFEIPEPERAVVLHEGEIVADLSFVSDHWLVSMRDSECTAECYSLGAVHGFVYERVRAKDGAKNDGNFIVMPPLDERERMALAIPDVEREADAFAARVA